MRRHLAIAAGAGLASALLFLSAASGGFGVLLTFYLAPLPLFLVGLGLGPMAVLVGNGAAVVVLALVLTPVGALSYLVATGAAPFFIARRAVLWQDGPDGRQWYPAGHLLLWIIGFAAAGVVALALVLGVVGDGLAAAVDSSMQAFADAVVTAAAVDEQQAGALRALLTALGPWAPGIAAGLWLLTMVANGILAQSLLRRSGRALRPSPAYSLVEVPAILAVVLGVAAAVAAMSDGDAGLVARAFVVVAVAAYALVGLAVVHRLSRNWPGRAFLLGVLYAALVIQGWLVIPIATLGLIETWAGLRQRQTAH